MSVSLKQFTLKDLLRLMDCPVCLQPAEDLDKYVQCVNGHFGCLDCYSKLATCPVCRVALGSLARTISDESKAAAHGELRHVENYSGSIGFKNILLLLKCDRCQINPTKRPVWQCSKGHLRCYECRPSLNNCASCQYRFFYRSLIAETLLSLDAKPCRFALYGCRESITELGNHEEEACIFRAVECCFLDCNTKVPIYKLFNHYEEANEMHHTCPDKPLKSKEARGYIDLSDKYFQTLGSAKDPLPQVKWNKLSFLSLDCGAKFIVECFASHCLQSCTFWVYYLGISKETNKFGFRLRLFNNVSNKNIHVTGPVISVNNNFFSMPRHVHAFKITFSDIKEFWGLQTEELRLFWEASVFQKTTSVSYDQIISVRTL